MLLISRSVAITDHTARGCTPGALSAIRTTTRTAGQRGLGQIVVGTHLVVTAHVWILFSSKTETLIGLFRLDVL